MSEFGFDIQDLSGAELHKPLSSLGFDALDYTPFEQLLEYIRQLPPKRAKVSNKSLSVNGVVVNDRMEKYLAHTGESSSLLKEALKSPRHYYISRLSEDQRPKVKNTKHFEFGTFVHSAVLEPEKFDKVKIMPEANLSRLEDCCMMVRYLSDILMLTPDVSIKEWKIQALRDEIKRLFEIAHEQGYSFIKVEDAQIIDIIRAGFNTYGGGILPKLMKYVHPETSMYGVDQSTGLQVKIRPDGMLLAEDFGINAILSVKTTSALSVDAFIADCARYRYELSEGMYLKVASEITGRPFTATLMLMIQSVVPFQMALLFWDAEDLQIGKYKYAQALDVVKQCRDANSWLGFDALAEEGAFGIIQTKLPSYITAELKPQYLPQ